MPAHLKLLISAAVLVLLACSDNGDPTTPPEVDALVEVSGGSQKGWPGEALANELVVKAVGANGAAISGAEVVWTVVSGGGELDPASSVTGPDGTAAATWTLGHKQVDQIVLSSVGTTLLFPFTAEAAVTGEWEPVAALLHAVRAPAVATDGQRIFVFGGTAGASPRTGHTQIFDPSAGVWSGGADIPKTVDWSAAVYMGGLIHLLGGVTDEAGATDEHWVYDVSGDSWSVGAALPTPAAGSASALVGGHIIVAGGIEAPGMPSDDVRIFDPASDEWSSGVSTPVPLYNWQGVEIDGEFFVAGGLADGRLTSSALWRFDLGSDSWTSHQPLPKENEAYAGVEISGLYCVIGGRIAPASGSFSPPFDTVSCYDPEMNAWLAGPTLPTAAEEMGAVSLDGTLYVFGGRVSFSGVTGEAYRLIRPSR